MLVSSIFPLSHNVFYICGEKNPNDFSPISIRNRSTVFRRDPDFVGGKNPNDLNPISIRNRSTVLDETGILTFQGKLDFKNIMGKGKMLLTTIIALSHNLLYLVEKQAPQFDLP